MDFEEGKYKLNEEVFKALDKVTKEGGINKLLNVSSQLSYLDDFDIDIIVNQYKMLRYYISRMTYPKFLLDKNRLERDEIDILALKVQLSKSRRGFLAELLFKNYNININKDVETKTKKSFFDKFLGGR